MGKCTSKPELNKKHSILSTPSTILSVPELSALQQVPSMQISPIARSNILASLKKNYLFRDLSSEEVQSLLTKVHYFIAEPNITIFDQGSTGTYFFIINSGKVSVIVNGKQKATLSQEDCFGELALLSDSKRKASIQTLCKSSFWVMSIETFNSALQHLYKKKFDKVRSLIGSTFLFKNLPSNKLDELSKLAKVIMVEDGKKIICEGDEDEVVFILVSGSVVFFKGNLKLMEINQVGEMFGEGALINGGKRMASCAASGQTELISISATILESIFGANYELMVMRNIAKNSILSDEDLWFLDENRVMNLCNYLKWKKYKDHEEVIPRNYHKLSMFRVVCCGSLATNDTLTPIIKPYSVIGMRNSWESKLKPANYYSSGNSVVGEITINELNQVLEIDAKVLCECIDKVKFLYGISFFSVLSLDSIKMIGLSMKPYKVLKDTKIFEQGDLSNKIYVVISGSFGVYLTDGSLARIVMKNEIFGERCLYEDERAASVICKEEGEIFSISKKSLLPIPEFFMLVKLAKRKEYYQKKINISKMIAIDKSYSINQRITYVIKDPDDSLYNMIIIPKAYLNDVKDCYKIVSEKNILLAIEHPLLMKMVSCSVDSFNIYFITEYVISRPLRSLKKLTESDFNVIIVHLIKMIEYLHSRDIIYRDLNPSNIMVTSQGVPYLWNFRYSAKTKNRAYSKVGEPFYRSPEMILGRGYSKATDIWSLGVIIYEIIYKTLPFNMSLSDAPVDAYEKILSMKLEFDDQHDACFKNFLNCLLVKSDNRLDAGYLIKNFWLTAEQVEDILKSEILNNHKLFKDKTSSSFKPYKASKLLTVLIM